LVVASAEARFPDVGEAVERLGRFPEWYISTWLDWIHHDTNEDAERDELKNLLFTLAGLRLVRIIAADTGTVRSEDF
jgi:hypothetical protein